MTSLNKIMVIGNLGTDPEMRYTPNGKPVTSFRLATTRSYNAPDGERKQETEWFSIVAWDRLAELCNQYLAKGRKVFVEGRLQSRSWEGRDGVTRWRNEIIASQVLFLSERTQTASFPGEEGHDGPSDDLGGGGDLDDLPF
jgi:single-strand DNA-binding protein